MEKEDKLRTSRYAREQLGGICAKTFWEWYKKGVINVVCINERNYVLDSEIARLKRGPAPQARAFKRGDAA